MTKITGSSSAPVARPAQKQLSPAQERQLSQLAERLWAINERARGWSPDARATLEQAQVIRKQINAIDPTFLDRARAAKYDD